MHDKLQQNCFVFMWNTYPELRGLFWGTFNDIKQVEKIIGAMMKVRITAKVRSVILSKMKSIGMVKGIVDFMFYHNGVLYVMDFKVGADKLSPDQKQHIAQVERQGGKGYEIRDFEQFKVIIKEILE